MSWNYCVTKQTHTFADGYKETTYVIREAYYNSDGSIWAVTQKATWALGETLDELRDDLEHMLSALEKPVLDYDTLVFAPRQGDE